MKVLVVESSRFHQIMISQIFNNEGIVVCIANNCEEAIQVLENETMDFICTAYHLPYGLDGIKLAKLIRTAPKTKDIPVILLTSNKIDNSFDHAYNSGVTEIYNRSDINTLSKNLKRSIQVKKNEINARVLFIEDSKTVATMMTRQMESMKMTVEHYLSASDALEKFKKGHLEFDIIITDLLVEGSLNGMGFVREIRKIIPNRSKLPILVISGFDDITRRIELLNMGANDYIVKPIVKEELVARLSNLVTTKQLFDQVKIQQEQLYQLAMTDQLTGLYNRHSLVQLLPKYFSHSVRHSTPLSVLVLDIDHFKYINDNYGHSKGDEVLSKFGQLITANFRSEDLVARYGGEEFVVIMANSNHDDTIEKAELLRTHIESHLIEGLKVTISIGVACADSHSNFEHMFNQADTALYHAKKNGRNQTITYASNETVMQ
ncbi:MAG: diguanylate cyclase [Gammaproteobacteria bacterium]|nr:diguanylate cyclase [Gammaproteobacteria bacterium]